MYDTVAIGFSSVSGLWGVYFVLFILAIWSTYHHPNASSTRLRVVNILLFCDLLAHFIAKSYEFYCANIHFTQDIECASGGVLTTVDYVTIALAGLLSDGIVAWRFYVIYDRRKWALYVPAAIVAINACLALVLIGITQPQRQGFYTLDSDNIDSAVSINWVIWGWFTFAVNTLLTVSIAGKILYVNHQNKRVTGWSTPRSPYATAIRAVVESGFVTWICLLAYEICSSTPARLYGVMINAGYVMLSILPVIFGISQCLIIVRLGFAHEVRPVAARTNTSKYASYESELATTPPVRIARTRTAHAYPGVAPKPSHDAETGCLLRSDTGDGSSIIDIRKSDA